MHAFHHLVIFIFLFEILFGAYIRMLNKSINMLWLNITLVFNTCDFASFIAEIIA